MKTKETFLKIDPPSGWKYGFPKAVTQEQYKEIKNLKQWCIDNGYPKEEADSYGDYFCIQINGDLSFMDNEKTTRQQAMAWWNKLKYDSPIHLEFYAKKYFQRDWDTLTGREIEEIWKNEVQVKELSNTYHNAEYLKKPNQKQLNITNCGNKNCQNGVINGINPKICKKCNPVNAKQFKSNEKEYIQRVGRVNRKQFKQFDESLFKAYIDKFSDEDKLKALKVLFWLLKSEHKFHVVEIGIDKL